jgi:hypothetical protein
MTENMLSADNDISISDEIRIVVLQRGWIFIGKYYQSGSQCELRNAYCIRRWGTERGLGELAEEGKKESTLLDKTGNVKFHELTVVCSILCNKSQWRMFDEF